ncbi:nitroreductase family protein [Dyella monticola]|uniref:Nitroreductase family protein n=2 Tax=Dyella monticola TaxID=1927958 RepID=A0A370XA47_9GAMM|nr:nitroreductase family protein [Dyella monticola]
MAEPVTDTWAAFCAINAHRRAVRDFDGGAVADEDMRAVLAEAQLAPSSNNLQPYQFHWIRAPHLRAQCAAACHNQRAAAGAWALIVLAVSNALCARTLDGWVEQVEVCPELDEASRAYHRKQLKIQRLFGRIAGISLWTPLMALASWIDPVLMFVPLGPSGMRHWATRNSLYAVQTLLLAIAAKGLDSCPMEGFSARKLARLLKLPRGTVIPVVIAVGRRALDARIEPRWRVPFDAAIVEH